jgi:hypothetical protein
VASARGSRYESRDITAVLAYSEASHTWVERWTIKGMLLGVLMIFGAWLAAEWPPVLPGIIYIAVIVLLALMTILWRLNDDAIQWFLDERFGTQPSLAYASVNRRGPEQKTDWDSIELGDFICASEEHAMLEAARQERTDTSTPPPDPLRYYHRVIGKFVPAGGGRKRIVVFGREQPYEIWPDSKLHGCAIEARPGKSDHIGRSAAALADLLDVLPDDQQAVREDATVARLITEQHHRQATVRLALRIALAGRLIARDKREGLGRFRYLCEVGRIFRAYAPVTGHVHCRLRLTESGLYWKRAGAADTPAEAPSADGAPPFAGTYVQTQHNVVIGDNNIVGNASSHVQHVMQNLDIGQLAEDLAKLRGVLTWQPSGPEYALAISYLASALRAAQQGDEPGP